MESALSLGLVVFLVGTFVAAFVTGLAGFAFGMVAAATWLHALAPAETTTLIVAYALLVQGYAVWKLRSSIDIARLAPFVIGSAVGIPLGIMALRWVSPTHLRMSVGTLLILFSGYNLARPKLPTLKGAGQVGDAGIGVLNGILGGSTGLGGIAPTIWSGMRGWSRDEQRAVFQPTAVATFLMTLIFLGGLGIITRESARLFVLGLPILAAGTWLGWALYGRLDEASFRRVVLVLLLISGLTLLISGK
jgi:uncharacterized membrane protein YfcA